MAKPTEYPKVLERTFRTTAGELVSSVRLIQGPGHERIQVWNRGGHAGELVVKVGDGLALVERLAPGAVEA